MLFVSFHAHEHLHSAANSGTGHIVKHGHFDDDHVENAGTVFDQEHHGADGNVEVHFKISKTFSFPPPAIITTLLGILSDESRIESIQLDIFPITHGPPRQPLLSRAPPSILL